MADDFTILNVGCDGDVMDESSNIYPTEPFLRKKPRIVVTGEAKDEIVRALAVDPSGTEYGLVVRNIPSGVQETTHPGLPIAMFGTVTLVTSSAETTITSYTVPAGKLFYVTGFTASGDIHAKYNLYLASSIKLVGRSSVAEPTYRLDLSRPAFIATAGDVVSLKVIHFVSGLMGEFEGTILGFEV
jgi:hypothetical protein